MGTAQVAFAEVVRGGATGSDRVRMTGSHVTGSDVSHVTGSNVSHVTGSGPDRKYIMRMLNRKLHNSRRSRAPEVTLVT